MSTYYILCSTKREYSEQNLGPGNNVPFGAACLTFKHNIRGMHTFLGSAAMNYTNQGLRLV